MKSEVLNIKRINKATVGLLKGAGGEHSEPEVPKRSPTVAAQPLGPPPDPEVPASPKRKQYSNAFKLRILHEAENAGPDGVGPLLRREGLYSSYLTNWRRQRERGELDGHSAKKRGPSPKMDESTRRKVNGLERENTRLSRRLKRAEKIIEIQKKIAELLGIPLNPSQSAEDD
jgi:transposase-like protein